MFRGVDGPCWRLRACHARAGVVLLEPFAANALNKALEGLTFDMDPLTIHDLRRTGATLLTENGFNKDCDRKGSEP